MKNRRKMEIGITLVALVVTIIVLLILAGVVISQITESGLLGTSNLAKEKYKSAQDKENSILSEYDEYINADRDTVTINKSDLEELINKAVDKKVSSKSGNPTGTIIAYIINEVPDGYLACNGQEVSRQTYSDLFTKIGTKYGEGDGSTTFKLPDLRGEFLKGVSVNEDPGTHTDEGLPNISGTFSAMGNGSHSSNINFDSATGAFYTMHRSGWYDGYTSGYNSNASYNAGFEASRSNAIYGNSEHVTPTNTSVLYCIKY